MKWLSFILSADAYFKRLISMIFFTVSAILLSWALRLVLGTPLEHDIRVAWLEALVDVHKASGTTSSGNDGD